ncbi:GAF domain-containing protein [Streptomyces sp. NPDC056105]|uniref:GAF domain-containing protein n=1 Tax=Streptomyces sp. NPDC056105 TaxID=3345714 RepID=UPI0035DD1617
MVTRCVHTGQPALTPHVAEMDLARIDRDPDAATLLTRAGGHSYPAVPLSTRGEVLGALDLKRARNPLPFGQDGVAIDNARWYQSVRNTAVTLQRSLEQKVSSSA